MWVAIVVLFVVVFVGVAIFLFYRLRRAPLYYRVGTMALPVSQLFVFVFLMASIGQADSDSSLLVGVVLLGFVCACVDIWLTASLDAAAELEVSRERERLSEENLRAQQIYGTRLSHEAAYARKVYDDVGAELDAIAEALVKGKSQEAEEGLGTLVELVSTTGGTPCEHKAVSALIALKMDAARDVDVRFSFDLQVPQDVSIGDFELCAIFSNLLDNALFAAEFAPKQRRFVEVTAAVRGAFFVVEVQNGMALSGGVALENTAAQSGETALEYAAISGDDTSLKGDAARPNEADEVDLLNRQHGWGQKIVQAITERYSGFLKTESADGIYRAVAALSIVQSGTNPRGGENI